MSKKKTQEDFIKELNKVYPDEFEVLGEYKNNRTKLLIKHNTCGKSYERYPYDLLKKRYSKCKYCYQIERMKNNIDNYIKENNLENMFSYDIGDALYQYEKIKIHCHKCNNVFDKVVDLFLQGQHCPYCAGQRTNKKYAQMKIDELTGVGEFTILNDNIDAHDSHIEVLHNRCGRVTKTSLSYFVVQNPICRHCRKEELRKQRMKTNEQFIKEMKEIYGDEYELISEYNGASKKVKLIHRYCNNIIKAKPNHILSLNFGCKFCNMSMPETIIYSVLKDNNIDFEFQYRFDDCLGSTGVMLPFDFAVFDNNELKFIIEYDGQHHFKKESFGEENYLRIIKNDNIKNNYCKENGIKLFRISYKELNRLRNIVYNILVEQLPNKIQK